MTLPTVEDQLLSLGSKAKIVVGLVLLIAGACATYVLWGRGWIYGATIFASVMGLALTWIGIGERREEAAIDAEIRRAEGEWDELAREIEVAREAGLSAARLLQGRGYSRPEVRRWILDSLDPRRDAAG